MFELIIFDCDGVLVDSELLSAQATAKAITEYGIPMDQQMALKLFTGITLTKSLSVIERQFGVQLGSDYLQRKAELTAIEFRKHLKPIPGIEALLNSLKVPFCLGSNSTHPRLEVTLDSVNLTPYFVDQVHSADDVEHGKPAPDLFLFAANRNNVSPDKCLVIDDSPTGIKAATAAGMSSIGFIGGTHVGPEQADKLRSEGAKWIMSSHQEVSQLIKSLETPRIAI